jgi:hypothetical protein
MTARVGLEGRAGPAKSVFLLLRLDDVGFAWGKEALAGMLGHPFDPSLEGAKSVWAVLEWSRRDGQGARRTGERCSAATEDLGLEA